MRRSFLAAAVVAALVPVTQPAHAETIIASCSAFSPRIAPPPNVPIPPNNIPNWAPYDPVEACFATFQMTTAGTVTTELTPDATFFGQLGLRVRGPNALYTQYEGVFANGELVSGVGASSFTLPVGTWTLDVYLAGTPLQGTGMRTGSFSIGAYSGRISG